MMANDSVMIIGPGRCGKKLLLSEVAADLGLKTKYLSPLSRSRESKVDLFLLLLDLDVWGKLLFGHTYKEVEKMCELAASFRQSELNKQDGVSLSCLREVSLDDFNKAIEKVPQRTSLSDLQNLKKWEENISYKKRE